MTLHIDIIPENPENPYRLGRHRAFSDEMLQFVTPFDKPRFRNMSWSASGPILDQANVGGCTGFTDADVINTDLFTPVRKAKHRGRYLGDGDGLNLYSRATYDSAVGGGQVWPPNDVGSTGPAAAQAGIDFGYFDRYLHCFTWAQLQATLEAQPVMLGVLWTNDMFNPDSNGVVTVGSLSNDNVAGGHEFMGRAIHYGAKLILCRNHWTDTWNPQIVNLRNVFPDAVPGEFAIGFDDIDALLGDGGDVTVPHGAGLPAAELALQ